MYKYLFGPVPSRRLGMSLGIDLVPSKICSLNCVYCEVGKTSNLTLERKEYISYDEVIAELSDYLNHNPHPDYITFSGSGEPTLNSRIGDVLHFIKQHTSIPVAVLTNGTLLSDAQVRQELLEADLVLPSLDSALETSFRKINRPKKDIDLETYIQGLVDFRKEYSGQMHLEILLLPGYNDTPEDLKALKEAILKIQPDRVQLNTLDRPGTVAGLHPMRRHQLQRIVYEWNMENVEIISKAPDRKQITAYRNDIESVILETIIRRPCTLDDLQKILGLHVNEINKYLDVLENEQKIEVRFEERGVFYKPKE